jgi:DNA-binding NarL/FixJ family response regulator
VGLPWVAVSASDVFVTKVGGKEAAGRVYFVLVVEDEAGLARMLARTLVAADFHVDTAEGLHDARALLARSCAPGGHPYSAVLLDLILADGHGEALIDDLAALSPRPGVAALTATADGACALRLLARGVPTIPKPIDAEALVTLVRRLCALGPDGDPIEAFGQAYALSPKEKQVLHAAALGATGDDLAARVGCTLVTVSTHWRRIFDKTKERSKPAVFAAIMRFRELGEAQHGGGRPKGGRGKGSP